MGGFLFIGIDPGFSGAIAFVSDGCLSVFDLPLMRIHGKRQVNAYELSKIISPRAHQAKTAIIEDVHAMPRQGVASTFRFGYNAGILLGVLAAHHVQTVKIKPAVWKSALNLSSDKQESLRLAAKLFPAAKHHFRLKKHDGRAEAAILAYYGQKLFS